MIRFILVSGFLIIFLVLSIPILIAEWIIGKFNQSFKDRSSLAIVQWAFRCIMGLAGTNIIILGEENIPKDTAVVYVGNHRSYFDVVMTYMRVPHLTGYIAKKEMQRWPLLRNWMRNVHCLFLDRSDVKQGLKTILDAIEKVKNGISICIFPEGTRNEVNDTFLPFHEGSFKIAEKGNVPIIPMSIVNAADIWEDHFPRMKKTTVVIAYCKPVYMKELDKEDRKNIGNYITNIISKEYFKNKAAYFS
ncbi:MAG: 1-acyl-sn-glycerol-3-phosphate acyltransferase [Bacteroidales bacterium]|nr:1-acyl-sn-glycerol-3-phosphate acyltransferase [Lachnoclostridium sp.]MCM1383971.1 1-acyl-sn-glycerol-3-phosphate acyltransferase [Lachnoclostridium sp.]MCM1464680.1 1-acyl-sn-glycerol-3-phosphate acyltransferase [Bacteroidales bacterium]